MGTIRQARFVRAIDTGERKLGEVEVELDGREGSLTALLERAGENGYKVRSLSENNADLALDWYDNSLHEAYVNIGARLADGQPAEERGGISREQFTEELLQFAGLREQLERSVYG